MQWIETLQLRSYRRPDRDAAIAGFRQMILPEPESGLGEIVLLQDSILDNDLCIVIRWTGEIPPAGKSSLGLKLASAFAEFGRIDHSVWRCGARIGHKHPRRQKNPLPGRPVDG